MKKLLFILIACVFFSTFSLAATREPSVRIVRHRVRHHVQHHDAHRAGRHYARRHHGTI